MLVDGVWYFVALALVNFLNLGFYRRTPRASQLEIQVLDLILLLLFLLILYARPPRMMLSCWSRPARTDICFRASLGYCVTWIMSQKLIIHLHGDLPLPTTGRSRADLREQTCQLNGATNL